MKIKSLVELAQAIEDGKKLEHMASRDMKWCAADYIAGGDSLKFIKESIESGLIRIKPEAKVIDLSKLIESGIDCDFSDQYSIDEFFIGKLSSICGEGFFCKEHDNYYEYCRPRMNHVHHWKGGECPLPAGVKVRVFFRDGASYECAVPPVWEWYHSGVNSDIIGFEVFGKADGWVYPWESE